MAPAASPPALQEATKNSTTAWQLNLESLFRQAKDRFPDVVWELTIEGDEKDRCIEEVWGHKAIVYARAPPSFQSRYFSFRPNPIPSPLPYSSSPTGTLPTTSALSLSLGLDIPGISRTPSPFRAPSPSPSTTPGTLLRLSTSINPTLFSNELEYLYTGKGFGEAFEFLFDSSESREEGDAEEMRIDKLRKDLVFMWRSRLYSDVRIALTGNFSTTHENTTAIFSSHRFVLVSRSPYFHTALVSWPSNPKPLTEPLTLTLPSPPFTPASLHFTLGFIYTGTLVFSHRTYDLDTAFHIMRSATYLSLQTLYDEIQARIVQEMMHGLFHAFLEFSEYERLTGGKWGTGGCRCRQCARRAPRVLEFAVSEDVKNAHLDRGARRALVGLFGEGWCTSEFASLPQKIRDSLLKGAGKRTTPLNVFALLFAAEHAMTKLNPVIDAWADVVREMILAGRRGIDEMLCSKSEECFAHPDWLELMETDGVRFEDGERVEWIMASIRRGMNEKNAATVYQTLVSSILLRPHITESDAPMLLSTSHIRVQVEQVRMDVLRWIGKHWIGIRHEGGFDDLEGWSIKEISDNIEVPVDDLIMPASSVQKGPTTKTVLKPTLGPKTDGDSDAVSIQSMRVSVLSRNIPKRGVTPTHRDSLASSTSSVRSIARSTLSTNSRASTSTAGPSLAQRKNTDTLPPGPRPDSKLTPATTPLTSAVSTPLSVVESDDAEAEKHTTPSAPLPKTLVSRISPSDRRSVASRTVSPGAGIRPKSSAKSVRSHASTARNAGAGADVLSPTLRPPRPTSSVSNTSDGSATFNTANTALGRSRRTSTASTVSNINAQTTGLGPSTSPVRSRRPSAASVTSVVKATKRPPVPPIDPNKLSPAATASKRPPSTASSLRSTTSTVSTAASAAKKVAVTVRKPAGLTQKKPPVPAQTNGHSPSPTPANTSSAVTVKGKSRATTLASDHKKTGSSASTGSASTLKRKGSSDTITKTTAKHSKKTQPPTPTPLREPLPLSLRGATLDIGIPCIISSKRKRFKAFARYIGEVEGESGPWVGVEVPVGESWAGDRDKLEGEGRQWNDGTWGGIRYFEIGSGGSEWDYGDDRAARRRRIDWVNNGAGKGLLKREGDQLSVDRAKRFRSVSPAASDGSNSESRGLFVRPQQVLYVVDAVGSDL